MFQKFIVFLIFLGLAVVCAIGGSFSKTIVCSNQTKTCTVYRENSILKTKQQGNIVNVSTAHGTSMMVGGVIGTDTRDFLACKEYVHSVKTDKGVRKEREYYLLPLGIRHNGYLNYKENSLNVYSNKTTCEIDRLALQRYIKSGDMNDFTYKVPTTALGFLWYLGSVLLVLLAFLILFKGEVVTEEEAQAIANETFTEEQKQEICEKAQNIANALSGLDGNMANKLSDLSGKLGNIKIDFDKK